MYLCLVYFGFGKSLNNYQPAAIILTRSGSLRVHSQPAGEQFHPHLTPEELDTYV